jgi:hypothetical protein
VRVRLLYLPASSTDLDPHIESLRNSGVDAEFFEASAKQVAIGQAKVLARQSGGEGYVLEVGLTDADFQKWCAFDLLREEVDEADSLRISAVDLVDFCGDLNPSRQVLGPYS